MNLTEDGLLRLINESNTRVLDQLKPLLGTLDVIQGLQVDIPASELSALLVERAKTLEARSEKVPRVADGVTVSVAQAMSQAMNADEMKARAKVLRFMSTHLAPGKTYRLDLMFLEAIIGDGFRPGLGLPPVCY